MQPFSTGDTALPGMEIDPGSRAVTAWQPFRGPFQRWPRAMDTILAGVALFLTLQMFSFEPDVAADSAGAATALLNQGFALLLAVVGNGALVWRRRHPLSVHAVNTCVCSKSAPAIWSSAGSVTGARGPGALSHNAGSAH